MRKTAPRSVTLRLQPAQIGCIVESMFDLITCALLIVFFVVASVDWRAPKRKDETEEL